MLHIAAMAHLGMKRAISSLGVPPLGTGQTWPQSRCHDHAANAETRYSTARHSTQGKINGLCMASEQWKAFSRQKSPAPVPSVSILQESQTSQPALCGHSWTRITQSVCPALDNAQNQPPVWPCPLFSHFIPADLLNWTCLISSYSYFSPDAADEDAPLTWSQLVFDNSSPVVKMRLWILAFDDE